MIIEHWGDSKLNWVNQIDTGLENFIYSLLLNEETQTVFVGGWNQIVKQFDLQSGKLVKEFSNLGVGNIICLSSFKQLLCVGGGNGNFSIIDIREGRILTERPVKTLIEEIYTSQFCLIKFEETPRIALIVSGSNLY